MLEKDPMKRISAQEATSHIWFSQTDTICNTTYEEYEINLTPSVRKIRRFNFKRKEKKVKNKAVSYSQAEITLSPARLTFMVYESTEESNQTDFTDLKKSSNLEMEEEIQ
jgi:serine/threonine protein kinase